ncbi:MULTISPECIES: GNAT family N-acetyltransferase [unclassified Achromobacter]|uniref:GNAT family N-acetyltransferase n=1 Tax=unclassified Achromobacter TaxID=2626865 RepID=UPI000B515551|nr:MULTISPECIES: GNAT family N-acetyltransferase [unclassified Achromobacter]OWT73599.1 GNAT family N-acetyltransferase [Achromobacter sp. HZ34]OWT79484.1 GNAT family N-acetyltransferase [Achromobacter sp. HZ28]
MSTTHPIEVRSPTAADAAAIAQLLASLGYPGTESFIERRLVQLLAHPDEVMLAAVKDGDVLGIISLHFIPQLALAGDFCRISYFCVSERARGEGIGALLEGKAVEVARERGCDRIELHCHSRRVDAHRFYLRQGYEDSPRYFFKSLVHAA